MHIFALAFWAVVFYAVFWVVTDTFRNWHFKGPLRLPVLGCALQMVYHYAHLHDYKARLFAELESDTIVFRCFGANLVEVINPVDVEYILRKNKQNYIIDEGIRAMCMRDLFGEGIFVAENEKWYVQRKLAARAIGGREFQLKVHDVFQHYILLLRDKVIPHISAQLTKSFDAHQLMYMLTLDAFSDIGFGVQLNSLHSMFDPTVKLHSFGSNFDNAQAHCMRRAMQGPPIIWQTMKKLNIFQERKMNQWLHEIDTFVHGMIQQRLAHIEKVGKLDGGEDLVKCDLLSRLVYAAHQLTENELQKEQSAVSSTDATPTTSSASSPTFDGVSCAAPSPGSGQHNRKVVLKLGERVANIDIQLLRDIVVNFLLAGRDTTACQLAWALYCLAKHPEVDSKAFHEIESLVGKTGTPNLDELREFHYLQAMLTETQRLYPTVPCDPKNVKEKDVLPSSGYVVQRYDAVMYGTYSMGRQTSLWGEDALTYRPERHLDPETGEYIKPDPFKLPAFQAGPRICLGMELANMESKLILISLLQKYRFTLVPGFEVKYGIALILFMTSGLWVNAHPREAAPVPSESQ